MPVYGQPRVRDLKPKVASAPGSGRCVRLGFKRPINFVFNPAAAVIAGVLGEEQVIYYRVDEYTEISVSRRIFWLSSNSNSYAGRILRLFLRRLYQSKIKFNPRNSSDQYGVDSDHFRKALALDTVVPAEIANLPRPIIGFFGLIADGLIRSDGPRRQTISKRLNGPARQGYDRYE